MGQERGSPPLAPTGLPAAIHARDFRLRLLTEADATELLAAVERARDSLRSWTAWSERVRDVPSMRRYLRGWLVRPQYGLEIEGTLRGMLGIYGNESAEEPWLDLGYWLEPEATGRGVMTRAVRALATAADQEILVAVHPRNNASLAVARRLGLPETEDRRVWEGQTLRVFRGRPDPFAALDCPAPSLRRLSRNDAEELWSVADRSREHLAPWMPWARENRRENIDEFLARDGQRSWAILRDEAITGVIGVNRFTGGAVEMGYWLAPDATGQGLVTNGVRELFRAGAGEGLFRELILDILPQNVRSEAVAVRLGLKPGAEFERDGRVLREWRGVPLGAYPSSLTPR